MDKQSPAWQGDFLTTGPPGNSLHHMISMNICIVWVYAGATTYHEPEETGAKTTIFDDRSLFEPGRCHFLCDFGWVMWCSLSLVSLFEKVGNMVNHLQWSWSAAYCDSVSKCGHNAYNTVSTQQALRVLVSMILSTPLLITIHAIISFINIETINDMCTL